MAAEDNSFVKQSLAETITGPSTSSRLVPKPTLNKARRLINSKDMAIRKAKADEDSGGILKSLGLTPSARRTPGKSSDKEVVTDWEEVDNLDAEPIIPSHHSSYPSTSKSTSARPPTTDESLNPYNKTAPNSMHPQSASSDSLHHQASSKPNESTTILNLRRQLAESQNAREELTLKNTQLERELNELKTENKAKTTDGKVLGQREYQELERQFDEQEKLLSGYQRENERSVIELEATRVRMMKMANLLTKVYGPEWEETISNMHEGSPGGTLSRAALPQRLNGPPLPTVNSCTNIPDSPAEKLSLQLAQVQLLVQGMERRLVSREAELEDLQKQSKLELLHVQDSFNRPRPKTKSEN